MSKSNPERTTQETRGGDEHMEAVLESLAKRLLSRGIVSFEEVNNILDTIPRNSPNCGRILTELMARQKELEKTKHYGAKEYQALTMFIEVITNRYKNMSPLRDVQDVSEVELVMN